MCAVFLYLYKINIKMKRGLLISGGGSWNAFGAGTLAALNKKYELIVGSSTGVLLTPLIGLAEWEILRNECVYLNVDDFFDCNWYMPKPILKNGKISKISLVLSLVLGKNAICSTNVLKKTIGRFVSEKYFEDLRKEGIELFVKTRNYSQIPSKIHYFSSLNEEYDEFKEWMWCACNSPLFTKLVKKSWKDETGNFHVGYWGDGGLSDLINLNQLKGRKLNEVDIVLHKPRINERFETYLNNNLIDNIVMNVDTIRHDVETECFYSKIYALNRQGIKVTIYWLPRILECGSFVFDKNIMNMWWEEGFNTAFDENRIDVFEPPKKIL